MVKKFGNTSPLVAVTMGEQKVKINISMKCERWFFLQIISNFASMLGTKSQTVLVVQPVADHNDHLRVDPTPLCLY